MSAPEIITVIDVETTGLDPHHDHITEIAAIRAEVSADGSIREIGRFQTFVALPMVNGAAVEIPPEITELTGISADDLRGAPDFEDATDALWSFAQTHGYGAESVIIAHNAPFDLAFLQPFYTPLGFACTRAISRLVDPDDSASLKYVCERYGIALNGHHRAMNDVEATLQVYAVLRQHLAARGIEYRNVVVDSAERPLTYTPPGARVVKIDKTKGAA